MQLKRILAGLLASLMLVSLLPMTALAAESAPLTRGQVCQLLLAAADDYHPGVQKTDVMKGDASGDLREDEPVTRAEALIMLSRAFGDLPAPVGDTTRWAYPAEPFSDLPDWAVRDLASVLGSGIVTGTAAGVFSPNDPVTEEELSLFIRRVYTIRGENLKDDFFATVNKQWLQNSTIPDGQAINGGLYGLNIEATNQVGQLITDIAAKTHAKGSEEQKIADLYHNVMNWDARNKVGIAPLQPYLDAVDAAKTLDDLLALDIKVQKELDIALLVGFGLTVDMKDSTKYTTVFGTGSPSLSKDVYAADEGTQKDAYLTYLTTLLTLGGAEAGEAARQAQVLYEVEKNWAAAMLNPQQQGDVDQIYNIYTMDQLKALFPHVDLDAKYAATGLKPESRFMVTDPGLTKAAAVYFSEEHLDELKVMMRVGLLSSFGTLLNREFTDASLAFQKALTGVEGALTDEQMAAAQVQSLLSTYLEKAYVKEYFSAKAKADMEQMISEIIAVYQERVQALDWMSAETKKMALKKLDSMGVKVGYPDKWDDTLDSVEIKSTDEGGSFFDNAMAVRKAQTAKLLTYQGKSVDKTTWICPAYLVNAYYNPTSNDITFPAAILQAPFYSVDFSRAKNLGGIGYIIAHEITHAFDNNGAKFDENGNAANWWTEADYAAFQALCGEVVAYYDGAESIPGVTCNGLQTLSENVADLGSAACITEIVSREATPDYATLFQAMAETWCTTSSRAYSEYINQVDVHAPNWLRGYMPAQTCDAFYTTFGIQPGDGMWIAPEDRVQIW